METRNLICIRCPVGCALSVEMRDGKVIKVEGQACKRGEGYAQKECTNPTRTVTSTIPVTGGEFYMLPVRTASDIPKNKIATCMQSLKGLSVKAPINRGDVIVGDVAGTGVDIIATRDIRVVAGN